ncbi:MAG: hypothetical protein Q8P90_00880 [bacterium]|nr:hypothetical protein [bacterium]
MAVGENTKYGVILAEWEVPEYIKYERTKLWFVTAGSIAIALLIYSIVTFNFLFAIIISIVVGIVYLHESRHPDMLPFMILEGGLVLGERFIPYRDISSFWIIYEPPQIKALYFGVRQTFRAELPIHLENQNPVNIRRILLNFLEEDLDKEEEAAEDILGRLMRL